MLKEKSIKRSFLNDGKIFRPDRNPYRQAVWPWRRTRLQQLAASLRIHLSSDGLFFYKCYCVACTDWPQQRLVDRRARRLGVMLATRVEQCAMSSRPPTDLWVCLDRLHPSHCLYSDARSLWEILLLVDWTDMSLGSWSQVGMYHLRTMLFNLQYFFYK